MVGYNYSMESMWTDSYGMDMESIWNGDGIHHSMSIPCGSNSAYGMRKWLGPQPKSFHIDSIWINLWRVKTSLGRSDLP